MLRSYRVLVRGLAALAAGNVCLQVGSCSPGDALGFVGGLNPCGTILNCDPRVYSFSRAGLGQPGTDPDVDIFCTYPPFCSPNVDPIYGGIGVITP